MTNSSLKGKSFKPKWPKSLLWIVIIALASFPLAFIFRPTKPHILDHTRNVSAKPKHTKQKNCDDINITVLNIPVIHITCSKPSHNDGTETTETDHQAGNKIQDEHITKSDLLAQQRMAYWGVWICFYTAVGVVFIILTLRETRIAALAMSEIGRTQVSAYLSAIGGSFKLVDNNLEIEIEVKNFGSSPAELVELQHLKLYATDGKELGEETVMGLPSIFHDWFGDQGINDVFIGAISPNDTGVGKIKIAFHGNKELDAFASDTGRKAIKLIINGSVSWSDVFSRRNSAFFQYTLGEYRFENAHELSVGDILVRHHS